MSPVTREFVAAAEAGRPVYISEVRKRFGALPAEAAFRMRCTLEGLTGADHAFDLVLPLFEGASEKERAFATEYFLASLYNIISTLGGEGLDLFAQGDQAQARALAEAFSREFGMDRARRDRRGYGRAVNVVERMLEAVPSGAAEPRGRFRWSLSVGGAREAVPAGRGGILGMCRDAVADLGGKILCGMDVGGTDIKICLAIDGAIVRLKEYDWFPTSFKKVDQLIEPILLLVRLVRLDALRATDKALGAALAPVLEPAMKGDADLEAIAAAVARGEKLAAGRELPFDGIGLCFPDVVVRDKIVGGEVYKTRGIRESPGIDYEKEFRKLSHLDVELRRFVKERGVVGIINDGPMAAFSAATEVAAVNPSAVGNGIFAHTLGTELGTGWVTEAGEIPDIPLEVYNCIIDLGSYPERKYEPDDVRSVNNFNTRLAGTLQKYTSQSGVFRLAMKYLPEANPALFREILEKGFVVERGSGYYVPTAPKDMRKPFLEFLMRLPERGSDFAVERIFREVGEFMAVAFLETEWILQPKARDRVLFGRLVKHRPCFALMVDGARRLVPGLSMSVADDELANTPLMKELKERSGFSVAQFAQAVGAVHYANYRLREAARQGS